MEFLSQRKPPRFCFGFTCETPPNRIQARRFPRPCRRPPSTCPSSPPWLQWQRLPCRRCHCGFFGGGLTLGRPTAINSYIDLRFLGLMLMIFFDENTCCGSSSKHWSLFQIRTTLSGRVDPRRRRSSKGLSSFGLWPLWNFRMRRSGKGLWQDGLLAVGDYESHVSEHELCFNPERTESVEAPVTDFTVHVPKKPAYYFIPKIRVLSPQVHTPESTLP